MGIKIGDVSGNINSVLGGLEIQTRSYKAAYLELSDRYIIAGQTLRLEVSGRGMEDLKGMQFVLKARGLAIEGLGTGGIQLDETTYMNRVDDLVLSWSDPGGRGFEEGEILFTIEVTAMRSGMISEMLEIGTRGMKAEVYTGDDLNVRDLSILFSPEIEALQDRSFMRVAPNPFSTTTTVQLVVPADGEVVMSFYDIAGRMLYVRKEMMAAGVQILEISKDDLNIDTGLVICRVSCGGVVTVKRLVVVGD